MAGHIQKRTYPSGKSRWRARHPDPSKGGTAKIERTFATKRQAENWLTNLKHQTASGTYIDPSNNYTFEAVADEWRSTWRPLNLKPTTKAGYDAILENHVLPRWGQARVNAVSPDRIQEWVNKDLATNPKTGKPRARKTVRNIYGVLHEVMALAQRRRYISANPCEAVRLPTKAQQPRTNKRNKLRTLSPGQIQALAKAVPSHYRTAVVVAAHTGLRAGELWALRRDDIDLLRGTISVDETLSEIYSDSEHLTAAEKGLVFGPPKSDAGEREFSLPAVTLELLKKHLAQPLAGAKPESLIFTTPSGTPVRHGLFYQRVFKPALRRAKLPTGLTFHDLRHTCASLTLSVSKGNFYLVKERLGHADIQTTVNTYGHLVPHADEKLAKSLSKLFEAAEDVSEPDNVQNIRGQ